MTLNFEWSSTRKVCLYHMEIAMVIQLVQRKADFG